VRAHKYHAKPQVVDGIRFASQKEARRYQELKLLEKAGEIRDLVVHPRFPLWAHTGVASDEPVKVGEYRGDFAYEEQVRMGVIPAAISTDGVAVVSVEWVDRVEDVKGFKTPLYKWKKKHVEAQYGIRIVEI
jgi:hypothetical protein